MGMETDGALDKSLQGFYVDVFQLRTESSYVSSINMFFSMCTFLSTYFLFHFIYFLLKISTFLFILQMFIIARKTEKEFE